MNLVKTTKKYWLFFSLLTACFMATSFGGFISAGSTEPIANLISSSGSTFVKLDWDDPSVNVKNYLIDYRLSKVELSGSIDPDGTDIVSGVNTLFTSELMVGDQIVISGEARIVAAINSDTEIKVLSPFSDLPNDTSVEKIPLWTEYDVGASVASEAVVKNLENNKQYDFRVRAVQDGLSGGKRPNKDVISTGLVVSDTPYLAGYDIVIVAGQSNAVGSALVDDLEPHTESWRVKQLGRLNNNEGKVVLAGDPLEHHIQQESPGFAMTFAREYRDNQLEDNREVLLIPSALSGSGFESSTGDHWGVDGFLVQDLINRSNLAYNLHSNNRFVAFLWHQGENEAGKINQGNTEIDQQWYEQKWNTMMNTYDNEIEGFDSSVRILIGEMNVAWATNTPGGIAITDAQQNLASSRSNAKFVSSEIPYELTTWDSVHFDENSLVELGNRYYKEFENSFNEIIDACSDQESRAAADGIVVCGSVEQIYIVNSVPGSIVDVTGPHSYSGVINSEGSLLIRNVRPNNNEYLVAIREPGETISSLYKVTVLDKNSHPGQSFYMQQTISDNEGYIRTRDGTLLSYYLEYPAQGCTVDQKCDLLITYSGYTPSIAPQDWESLPFDNFVPEGYAVIGINMRGSACSGGAFNLMEELVLLDGYDAIETLSAQEWVDNVAMVDKSWPGLSQLFVASVQPPSLDAIVPGAAVSDMYRDVFYPGGIRNSGFGSLWLRARDSSNASPSSNARIRQKVSQDPVCKYNQKLRGYGANGFNEFVENPFYNSYWQERTANVNQITVPTMLVVSWQDPITGSRVADVFSDIPESTPKRLIGVNGGHNQYWNGEIWLEVKEFLNTYLKGSEAAIAAYEEQDPVKILIESNGEGISRASFTLPDFNNAVNSERFALGDMLYADNEDLEISGQSSFHYSPKLESYFWSPVVNDLVSFTSDVLTESKLMAGSGSVDLWVSANSTDVDLRATISEVRPDGTEMFVKSGWLRASKSTLDTNKSSILRPWHSFAQEDAALLVPGNTIPARIELPAFAHVFRKDSKIKITVDAVPGPGGLYWWTFDTVPGAFDVSILHNSSFESSVVLPIIKSVPVETILGDTPPPTCVEVWEQTCR